MNSSEIQMSGLDSESLDKKLLTDRSQLQTSKLRPENDEADRRSLTTVLPFPDLVDPNESDMEDQSTRSHVSRRHDTKFYCH